MQINKIAIALLGAFALAGNASALQFTGSTGSADVTDFSAGNALSFDIDFSAIGSSKLNFVVEQGDVGQEFTFSSLVRNLSGLGFNSFALTLQGVTFLIPGTISTDGFQAVSNVYSNATTVGGKFTPALTTEFYLGNPLLTPGLSDWTFSTAGLRAGDSFSVTLAVPEPESYALMLAGLGMLGVAAKRRKQA